MRSHFPKAESAFTLIELLVVIAIIAILAVVVVLVLNPAQLLAQSRDSNRVSDMATLNSAINLYQTDQSGASGYSLGTASTSYISVPDSSISCADLGLPSSPYSYHCASARSTNGSGWVPINFQSISAGAPFGSLPVDPTNQTSSNLYYTYETDGTKYALSTFVESAKYAKNMESAGGIDPALYEIGPGITSLPNTGRGLVGYWPLNEGQGTTAIDWSGYGNNGTWNGSTTNGSYYTSPAKIGSYAGNFNGVNDYTIANNINLDTHSAWTVSLWSNGPSTQTAQAGIWSLDGNDDLQYVGTGPNVMLVWGGTAVITVGSLNNQWTMWTVTRNGSTFQLFVNGALIGGGTSANTSAVTTFKVGQEGGTYFSGAINDVRVYDRTLSAAEIQEIYNAEK